jgi:hypothetical protein
VGQTRLGEALPRGNCLCYLFPSLGHGAVLFVGCVDSYPGRASRGPSSPGLGYTGVLSVWFDMPNSILVDGIVVPDVMGGRKWEKVLLVLI